MRTADAREGVSEKTATSTAAAVSPRRHIEVVVDGGHGEIGQPTSTIEFSSP